MVCASRRSSTAGTQGNELQVSDAMKSAHRLTAAVAVLMLAQSVLGLLYRGQYRDVEWIAAMWLGNDWVTLGVALPLLAAGLVLTRHGSAGC